MKVTRSREHDVLGLQAYTVACKGRSKETLVLVLVDADEQDPTQIITTAVRYALDPASTRAHPAPPEAQRVFIRWIKADLLIPQRPSP